MASVTRANKQGRASRRQAITDALLEHAERLLQTESWTGISLERICAESGVPRSTFYRFFEDQGHLLTVLADQALGRITDAGQAWWSLPRDAEHEDLVKAIASIFDAYAEHGILLTALIEASTYDERVREQLDELMERSFSAVTQHIERGQAEGWIAPSLNAGAVAHWLSWMGESGLRAMLQRGERPGDKMIEAYADVVWNVLYRSER